MDIEDIAHIDLALKLQNPTANLLDVDNLIIAKQDVQAISKFKNAAYRLNGIEFKTLEQNPGIQETWDNLFGKQIRFSVNRAKEKK